MKTKVFLGIPHYGGQGEIEAMIDLATRSSRRFEVAAVASGSSLVPRNCTKLWADALNSREIDNSILIYAQLHTDVIPEPYWIDTLWEQAELFAADFISAVIPFKDKTGLTSTALLGGRGEGLWESKALTLSQVNHSSFPTTFDSDSAVKALGNLPEPLRDSRTGYDRLLANTGCMVCRLDRSWCDSVWFQDVTRMIKVDGKRISAGLSEDWFFSLGVADHGGKVVATKAVKTRHVGRTEYLSTDSWGQLRDMPQ